jgi:cytochrome c-type biogenesis protein CcmH/NrfF
MGYPFVLVLLLVLENLVSGRHTDETKKLQRSEQKRRARRPSHSLSHCQFRDFAGAQYGLPQTVLEIQVGIPFEAPFVLI